MPKKLSLLIFVISQNYISSCSKMHDCINLLINFDQSLFGELCICISWVLNLLVLTYPQTIMLLLGLPTKQDCNTLRTPIPPLVSIFVWIKYQNGLILSWFYMLFTPCKLLAYPRLRITVVYNWKGEGLCINGNILVRYITLRTFLISTIWVFPV
jgi:hypothetical protein